MEAAVADGYDFDTEMSVEAAAIFQELPFGSRKRVKEAAKKDSQALTYMRW